jgi:hypothetical protein
MSNNDDKKLKIDPNLLIRHENRELTFKELIAYYLKGADSIKWVLLLMLDSKIELWENNSR